MSPDVNHIHPYPQALEAYPYPHLHPFVVEDELLLRVRTVAKRHKRSSMFTASFILVSCVKLP